ncbi:PLEKHH2 (predicted) [Pycnogonum litorale]
MERKVAESSWVSQDGRVQRSSVVDPLNPECKAISELEVQIQEQKQLRMQDAKKVEAKAAKIKDWVAHKLKELEDQNQHLRQQNEKCNEQMELLKNRLIQLSELGSKSKAISDAQQSCRQTAPESQGFDEISPPELPIRPPSETLERLRKCRRPLVNEDVAQLEFLSDSTHSDQSDDHGTSAIFNDLEFGRSYSEIGGTHAKEENPNAPPRVKIERKNYSSAANSSMLSSIASDDTSELVALAEELLGDSSIESKLCALNLNANESTQVDVNRGPSTSINDMYSVVKKKSRTKCDAQVKPVPPPRASRTGSVNERVKLTANSSSVTISNAVPSSQNSATSSSSNVKHGNVRNKQGDSLPSTSPHKCANLINRKLSKPRADNEVHDYAEIYTPSGEQPPDIYPDNCQANRPPTPPLHRCPSWESKIYDIAVNGMNVADAPFCETGSPNNNSKPATQTNSLCTNATFRDINVPVYTSVKGRASQIRSVPFSGGSSEDSSENEDTRATVTTNSSNTTSGETESSHSTGSPIKCIKTTSIISPTKHHPAVIDDYAIPPDALSSDALSIDSSVDHHKTRLNIHDSPKKESLEKSGYLTKLAGKLKTWRKRWFVLKNGTLSYYKSENDINRKPQGQVILDDVCRVTRAEGASTFEIATGKRTYYLSAESAATMEEWIKILQNVLRRNATRLMLSKEENKPTIQGWLTKVKHGHSRKCWCVLIGKMFLYFKTPNDTTPLGQINMRDARVEEVEHVSDSDEDNDDDRELDQITDRQKHPEQNHTIGIFPSHQGPTYILMPSKQEKDSWMYHLTVVSSGGSNVGTHYEQLITRLMEMDGDSNCVIWRHPLLLYTKDNITQPLTTLPSEELQKEAIKLFKSCQLFMSVPVDTAGIDYHVVLAQNSLQQCLHIPELQNELYCQLIKQTSRHTQHKLGVQQLLLCATQSLFLCDASSGSEKSSPSSTPVPENRPSPNTESKLNPSTFVFIQGWQLLSLAISLFIPKNRLLWYLRAHLQRNVDTTTEVGKYAIFCQRALERTIDNCSREAKPSRMEVLSVLLKNPYHHSLPHSIPVHFLNGTYQVVGFDGSTTVEEFTQMLNIEIGMRDTSISGFALYSDDPFDFSAEHLLKPNLKICDVISKWETALREKGLGKFQNTKVIRLLYKNRLYFRQLIKLESDKERLLMAYQTNDDIVNGRLPASRELALELATIMAQVEFGDFNNERTRGSSGTPPANPQHQLQQVTERFYPRHYRSNPDDIVNIKEQIRIKWKQLKGRNQTDSIRVYLNCVRKWPFYGAKLYLTKLKGSDQQVWLAVQDDGITTLDNKSMLPLNRYPYESVVTFGGCREDFMLVINHHRSDKNLTEKLLFCGMAKPKIFDLTLLIADYMNAFGHIQLSIPATPQTNTLTRLEKIRARLRAEIVSGTVSESPDLVKMTTTSSSDIKSKDSKKRSGSEMIL